MVKIYTAQYRYSGGDRLDITVKGKDVVGRVFAPTWKTVIDYKNNKDILKYTNKYYELMRISYIKHRNIWENILSRECVTFVCFCAANDFCHRHLLAEYFSKLGGAYLGERNL